MPRILAIDYGTKRVGLAVTDPQGIIVTGDLKGFDYTSLLFYPNPVSDHLIIFLNSFEQDKEVSVSITDMLGRSVEQTVGRGKQELKIDVQQYLQGQYILQLQQNKVRINRTFIKQ